MMDKRALTRAIVTGVIVKDVGAAINKLDPGRDHTLSEACNECLWRWETQDIDPACWDGGCDRAGPTKEELDERCREEE